MEENMATDISSTLFASAMAPQPVAFHPAVEPRRTTSPSSQAPRQDTATESSYLTTKEIEHAVGQMNELAKVMNHRLSFTMDYETNDVIVKVVDADTDKVIRELPPAELQKLHKSIKEALGLLIDKMI
jgi:flagellar protein FlaG